MYDCFAGITGDVNIDGNGDRIADYSLLDMNPETSMFEVSSLLFLFDILVRFIRLRVYGYLKKGQLLASTLLSIFGANRANQNLGRITRESISGVIELPRNS